MTRCRPRCERLTAQPGDIEGFLTLSCVECGRPIGLVPREKRRPAGRPRRGDLNRAMRAARRKATT